MDRRDAYATRALRDANRDDTWWACDVELRDDGNAHVVPLTIDRVEAVARLLWEEPTHPRVKAHFSVPPT